MDSMLASGKLLSLLHCLLSGKVLFDTMMTGIIATGRADDVVICRTQRTQRPPRPAICARIPLHRGQRERGVRMKFPANNAWCVGGWHRTPHRPGRGRAVETRQTATRIPLNAGRFSVLDWAR